MKIGRQVFYSGRVQGVGFRYTARNAAREFEVAGWVKNLPDGRVELQVTGEGGEVRGFLDAVREGELHSLIKEVEEHEMSPLEGMRGFEIRF